MFGLLVLDAGDLTVIHRAGRLHRMQHMVEPAKRKPCLGWRCLPPVDPVSIAKIKREGEEFYLEAKG
jgi:hypothetical protein